MQYLTHITAIQRKTPNVKLFTLDYGSQDFHYHPGQWVDIHLTIDDETHNCGYSITSIPSTRSSIDVAVKLAPELKLTDHLHHASKIGDKVFISHAQGDVYITDDLEGPYVFVAGGVGITPLYSMIQLVNAQKPQTSVTLIYSISTPEEFLFAEELKAMENANPNFRCFVTVTRAQQHREAFTGRINAAMLREIALPVNANYYLCGPPQMVDDVAALLITLGSELEITENNIRYDRWWA